MASAAVNLPPKQKAAILLMSLPPEVSAQLFKELGPDEVHAITLEISKLPPISPDVRAQVIDEFLHSSAGSSLSDALEKLAKERPTKVAEMLKSTWLSG